MFTGEFLKPYFSRRIWCASPAREQEKGFVSLPRVSATGNVFSRASRTRLVYQNSQRCGILHNILINYIYF